MKVYRIGGRDQGSATDVVADSPSLARQKLLDYLRDELHYTKAALTYVASYLKRPRLIRWLS